MFTLTLLLQWSFASVFATGAEAPTAPVGIPQPEELGAVTWLRDYEEALTASAESGKPVFVLFQEVPGCSNCTRYGNAVLSHPLIVEAIETEFVPLAVFNNKRGADAAVLKRYGEPSWNNPVTRIVNAEGEDIVARMPNFGSTAELLRGMNSALRRSGKEVPAYLRLLFEEYAGRESGARTATYETACFWSGEGFFGEQAGVIATEAGWQNGREVVRVRYDAGTTARADLDAAAAKKGYRLRENGAFRLDREPKYYLSKSRYAVVPMAELQASRVNALLGQRRSPDALLSPRQLQVLAEAEGRSDVPSAIGEEPLADRWSRALKAISGV